MGAYHEKLKDTGSGTLAFHTRFVDQRLWADGRDIFHRIVNQQSVGAQAGANPAALRTSCGIGQADAIAAHAPRPPIARSGSSQGFARFSKAAGRSGGGGEIRIWQDGSGHQ